MQVSHETQLVEGSNLKPEDFVSSRHSSVDRYTLYQTSLDAVDLVATCPVLSLVAIYLHATRQIVLIDTRTYQKREKFPLKSCDKKFSKNSFALSGLSFSPDGSKLAVAQSDCIIYIYKLASLQNATQTEASNAILKPTISGKFVCSSPVTCITWTEHGIVFGTQDGKIKLILMTTKATNEAASINQSSASAKVINLFNPPKANVPLCLAYKNPNLVVGYLDGVMQFINLTNDLIESNEAPGNSLSTFKSSDRRNSQLATVSVKHFCVPYHMQFIQSNTLCCAESNGRITLHSLDPSSLILNLMQTVDLKEDIASMDYSSVNDILAIATTNRLMFLCKNQNTPELATEISSWQLQSAYVESKSADSIFNQIASVKWLKDGQQLVVGNLNGSLELFRSSWNATSPLNSNNAQQILDICHIAKNRVRITDKARNLLATYKTQNDIKKVNLLENNQSVIIWSANNHLLLARLDLMAQSEIQLPLPRQQQLNDKMVKFSFENLGFVLIHLIAQNQYFIVKLGQDSILYNFKLLESIRKKTISIRQYCVASLTSSLQSDNDKHSPTNVSPRTQRSSIGQPPSMVVSEVQSDLKSARQQLDNRITPVDSKCERLAYVKDSNNIVIVDLKTKLEELIHFAECDTINSIELSNTTSYLVFVSNNRVHLLSLKKNSSKQLMPENCSAAKWVPRTEILVGQASFSVIVWYDIESINKFIKFDTRSYNFIQASPTVDLSLHENYPRIDRLTNDQIVLSNNQIIQLDRMKVKFYQELFNLRLDLALETLETMAAKESQSKTIDLSLWNKLGWIAIDNFNCEIARDVFERINHKSMVKFLNSCLELSSEVEFQIKFALLRGDWQLFEELAESEKIISLYRKLNKWTKLVGYLNATQQFRQKDLVEVEYRNWLIGDGRFTEAAKLLTNQNDLSGAVELLMENERYDDALSLLIENQGDKSKVSKFNKKLIELAGKLKSSLIDKRKFKAAAKIADKILEESQEAIDLYLRDKSFLEALELARIVSKDQVISIEKSYGENLLEQFKKNQVSRKRALPAIKHLLNAKCELKALEAAIELNEYQRSYEILIELAEQKKPSQTNDMQDELKGYSNLIAEHMLNEGKFDEAIEAYLINENYEKVINLCIDKGQYKRAYEISLEKVNSRDKDKTVEQFMKLARDLKESRNRKEEAEFVYLMLDKPDLAIELNREAKNYDRMLEIIKEHQTPDILESQLLLLARQMESEGNYKLAEKYSLQASETEWTNVIRMYRLAGKYEEAFRVAKANCSSDRDPLLIQLAYWWAKSLSADMDKARALLKQLNLTNLVIEFCCDNKNYQLAIDLCKGNEQLALKSKEIIKRYAAFLEEMHKFDQAEKMLLENELIEEAIRMYMDNEMYLSAIKLIESQLAKERESDTGAQSDGARRLRQQQLVELLNKTLVDCANRMIEEVKLGDIGNSQMLPSSRVSSAMDKLLAAQQFYLRAQKPELAVEMYKSRGLWQEAVQVAQRFAPQLLERVETDLDNQVSEDVAPIIATINTNQINQSRSSSSSRSSLLSNSQGTAISQESSQATLAGKLGQATDFLHNQVELSMRNESVVLNGNDFNKTKNVLSKFISSITDGHHESEPLTAKINEWLAELERSKVRIDSLGLRSKEQFELILKLTDMICMNCNSWGCYYAPGGRDSGDGKSDSAQLELIAWFRLRDILLDNYLILLGNQDNEDCRLAARQLERRLLASHYITLYGCLVMQLENNLEQATNLSLSSQATNRQPAMSNLNGFNSSSSASGKKASVGGGLMSPKQAERLRELCSGAGPAATRQQQQQKSNPGEILDLVAKLSLSLLRYTNILEFRHTFYVAGFWLLASSQRRPENFDLARFVWAKLIEFCDNKLNTGAAQLELQQAGVPASALDSMLLAVPDQESGDCGSVSRQQLVDVRQWLIEKLIDSSASPSRLPLDERGLLESSLQPSSRHGSQVGELLPACLACGYPVFEHTELAALGRGSRFKARSKEWSKLLAINVMNSEQKNLARKSAAATSLKQVSSSSKRNLQDVIDFILKLSDA